MVHQDVLMRQVQQLAEVLSQILFNKRNEQYDEALQQLRSATIQLLNLDLTNVEEITFDELWKGLHQAGGIDPHHAGLVAELLKNQGDINRIEDRAARALRSYELALHLYLMLHDHPGTRMDYRPRVEPILDLVDPYTLSSDTQRLLVRYLLDTGRFDQAENVLFVWAESDPVDAQNEAGAFYDRLSDLTDEQLAEGGLPRDEVAEGREDFAARFGFSLS